MLRIGKIIGTHGVQGELVLSHILPHGDWLKKGLALFIAIRKDSQIPYFIKSFSDTNEGVVKLFVEEIESMEDAKKLKGKDVYVQDDVVQFQVQDSPLAWLGFKVWDQQAGDLGVLKDVVQHAQNWIGTLEVNGHEVLIPLIAEFIIEIDIAQKKMKTQLPDGLIEVYTS